MEDPVVEMIRRGAKIVDVRSREEFEDERYPGAINIPVNELPRRLAEMGPRDGEYVLYCASGSRSAFAARALALAGYRKVLNAGGLADMPVPVQATAR